MAQPTDSQHTDLTGLVTIVTGSNTGIGRATAAALAARGANVILACRSEERTRPVIDTMVDVTGNGLIEFLPLDLGDLDSVRAAVRTFLASKRPLNLLVNNAGVAGQRGMTKSGFELAFGTNHIGPFLFTTLLLDRLLTSAPARVVNVTSSDHFRVRGIDWDRVREPTRSRIGRPEYSTSKLANVCFTQELTKRYGDCGVTTLSVNPGPVSSDIWRPIPRPVYEVLRIALRMRSTEQGARPTLRAALDPDLEQHGGAYLNRNCTIVPASPFASAELGDELWRRSAEWVGVATS